MWLILPVLYNVFVRVLFARNLLGRIFFFNLSPTTVTAYQLFAVEQLLQIVIT